MDFLSIFWSYFRIWKLLLTIIILKALRYAWQYVSLLNFLKGLKKYPNGLTYFHFPNGILHIRNEGDRKGDTYHLFKELTKKDPKIRFFGTHFGSVPTIYLIDPQLCKDFLSDQSRYQKPAVHNVARLLMGKSVLFLEGALWKKHRKFLSEMFRFEYISGSIPVIVSKTKKIFTEEFKAGNGKDLHILNIIQKITAELVFDIFFGQEVLKTKIDDLDPISCLLEALSLVNTNSYSPENLQLGFWFLKLGLLERNRKLFSSIGRFNNFCIKNIEIRRAELERLGWETPSSQTNLLDFLLKIQKDTKGTGDELTNEEILQEFVTMFVAGMGTTAYVLTMALYFYKQQGSKVQEAVLKEAEMIAKGGEKLEYDILNKVEVINAFIKETLRLGSPSPFLFEREALYGHYIGDIWIPKNALVNVSFISNTVNSEYFKNYEEFNPYRWVQGHPDYNADVAKHPFIFTPFSAGQRNCIGQHLAMIEARIILSIFLANFEYTLPQGYKLHMIQGFHYGPREPILIDVKNKDPEAKDSYECK